MSDCNNNKNYPEIKFDSSTDFTILSTSEISPQTTTCLVVPKNNIPIIRLAYSPTPTKTPTTTPTTTRTPTVTPTLSLTRTVTPTSATKTPTPTPTKTPTVTPTTTRSQTPTPTLTRTVTPTKSVTNTPTLTQTSSPTPTPSRGCLIGETYDSYNLDINTSWSSIAYGNSTYSIVENLNASLYGSDITNLSVGQGLPLSGPNFWKSTVYANDRFVCVGACPSSAYSTNGSSWILGSGMPTVTGSITFLWNDIIHIANLNKFAAVASNPVNNSPSKIAFSSDGISWSSNPLPLLLDNSSSNSICKNFLTLATNNNNTIVLGSDINGEWNNSPFNWGPSFLVSTNGGTIWTERKPSINTTITQNNYIGNITKIVYGNNMFVAICKGKSNSNNCYRIFYSSSGISWTLATTINGTDANVLYGGFSVYGDGKFLLVINSISENNYTTYHSQDGIWWYSTGSIIEIPNKIQDMISVNNNMIILSTDKILISNSCLDGFGY